jgi:thioredoxin reductase
MPESFDAVIIGAGPNGLAAAITLAALQLSHVISTRRSRDSGRTPVPASI